MLSWKIANIDDLSIEERNQLDNFNYHLIFRGGLFLIPVADLKKWEEEYNFDSWFVYDFPKGYIERGWLAEDLDNMYDEISSLIYDYRGSKALEKYNKILNKEHPEKSLETIEEQVLTTLNKWKGEDVIKYSENENWLEWLVKELVKV